MRSGLVEGDRKAVKEGKPHLCVRSSWISWGWSLDYLCGFWLLFFINEPWLPVTTAHEETP